MKNLNLNRYYEGLGVDEINGLVARMNELESAVYSLEEELAETDADDPDMVGSGGFVSFEEDTVLRYVTDIEDYMKKLGKQPLFPDVNFISPSKEDFMYIIKTFRTLMSEE